MKTRCARAANFITGNLGLTSWGHHGTELKGAPPLMDGPAWDWGCMSRIQANRIRMMTGCERLAEAGTEKMVCVQGAAQLH